MTYEVSQLEGDELDRHWGAIAIQLRLVSHTWDTWWTEEALHLGAMNGHFQVWAIGPVGEIRGIAFTQVVEYPANRILHMGPVFGDGWTEMLPTFAAVIEKFGVARGCTVGEIGGRVGWEKVLRPYGFRKYGVTLVKHQEWNRSH